MNFKDIFGFFIAATISSTSFAQISAVDSKKSQSSTVTIWGKTANFLYYSFSSQNLSFTECVKGPGAPYLGTVECVLDVFSVVRTQSGIRIYGYAANELYTSLQSAPHVSGISCYLESFTTGESLVFCILDAKIVETNGL